MTDPPRILIGTLYSGENEFEQCKASVRAQTYPHREHVVFKNLPNKEAHDTLYRTFMERADEFQLFVKLDADMVLGEETLLEQIVDYWRRNDGLDHLSLAVRDWYTDDLMEGMHVFSHRVQWHTRAESRFVDHSPVIPGERRNIFDHTAPVVHHSPDPSPVQAFRFGVHRALKVFQPERTLMQYGQMRYQWEIIKKCWRHFERSRDRRLGLAIVGAENVMAGTVTGTGYDDDSSKRLAKMNETYASWSAGDMHDRLAPRWNNALRREARYVRTVGPGRFALAGARHLAYRAKRSSSG